MLSMWTVPPAPFPLFTKRREGGGYSLLEIRRPGSRPHRIWGLDDHSDSLSWANLQCSGFPELLCCPCQKPQILIEHLLWDWYSSKYWGNSKKLTKIRALMTLWRKIYCIKWWWCHREKWSKEEESEKSKCYRSVVSDSFDPIDCRPPGSSVHGILQARILEWVAVAFSGGSPYPGIQL